MLRMGEPERERSERLSQNHPLKLVEPGSEERAARVETTRNRKTDPTPSHHGFDTTCSLTLVRMLNQLPHPATASPP